LKRGNAPASSWIPAAATVAHRTRHRANKINPRKSKAAFGSEGRFFVI
jgi:hypothetical protein